jgi:hypothetical protein
MSTEEICEFPWKPTHPKNWNCTQMEEKHFSLGVHISSGITFLSDQICHINGCQGKDRQTVGKMSNSCGGTSFGFLLLLMSQAAAVGCSRF